MPYICAGRITDSTYMMKGSVPASYSDTEIKNYISVNNDIGQTIPVNEIDYTVCDASQESRLKNGDSFNLQWTSNVISDIDFSPENAKMYFGFTIDRPFLIANGFDTGFLTISVVDINNIPQTGFSQDLEIPIETPVGVSALWVSIVSGTASNISVTLPVPGKYKLPGTQRFSNHVALNTLILTGAVG